MIELLLNIDISDVDYKIVKNGIGGTHNGSAEELGTDILINSVKYRGHDITNILSQEHFEILMQEIRDANE